MARAPLFFRKQGGALVPVTEQTEKTFNRLPSDRDLIVEVKQARNIGHHRKFWALAQLVFENQDYFPTVEALVAALKTATGHCDMIEGKGGVMVAVPHSISFASMKQPEFNAFYDGVLTIVAEKFLPGVSEETLRREVEQFL